ncbi:MAG TPA: hypothetical protein VMZ28_12515 [Kofleriaceae bacterium]|nr:hypothetical protein [Kofleriaceae bacterium]
MAEADPKKSSSRRRAGCLVLVLAVGAAVVGGGVWLGKREEAEQTPCERYAHEAGRALANCHSGAMDHPRLLAACKEVVPDEGCFERLGALACEVVEKDPGVVVDVCRKKP